MQKIDMEQISKEIQEAAKTRGYPEKIPEFEGNAGCNSDIIIHYNFSELQESIKDLSLYATISEYPEQFGNGIKGFVKRFIIKCVRFYILPIVEKQNLFNRTAENSAMQVYSYIYEKEQKIDKLQKQIDSLQQEIEILKNKEDGE